MHILNKLDHPNIIRFYEDFEDAQYYALVIEYFEGETLKQYFKNKFTKGEKCKEKIVEEIMEQLIRAIAHCHENGVCHRDLKPDNILIDKNNELKVIDFGLSKHIDRNIRSLWSRVGTPAYMAPEVVRGNKYDLKCDIWSLGVVMYNLICGNVPFVGINLEETLALILEGRCNFKKPVFKGIS